MKPGERVRGGEMVRPLRDAQVTLSIPIEAEGSEPSFADLFECVEEFTHRATQGDLFVYTVETEGRTFRVDMADRTIEEVPKP